MQEKREREREREIERVLLYSPLLWLYKRSILAVRNYGRYKMLDNVNFTKVTLQANAIVIGLSMLKNFANGSSVPNDGSLTVP